MYLKKTKLLSIVLITQILLATSFMSGMKDASNVDIEKFWKKIINNKDTDTALKTSGYISENIGQSSKELLVSLSNLEKIDSRKVREPYTVVINLLDALNKDSAMGKELFIVRKIAKLARKYLFMAVLLTSHQDVRGTEDAVNEKIKLLKERYKNTRQNGIYYETGMMEIEKELLDSIKDKKELQKYFANIATQILSGGVTTGVSIARGALTGGIPPADSLPLEQIAGIFSSSFSMIKKYLGKIDLLKRFGKWIELNEQGNKALQSEKDLRKFFKLIHIRKLDPKKPHWRILYKGLSTLYLIVRYGKTDEIRSLAFERLLDFVTFKKFKVRNNWRIRQRAVECLILLSQLKKSVIPTDIINRSNSLIEQRIDTAKSNKNREKDPRVLYFLCNKVEVAAAETPLSQVKGIQELISKQEEKKNNFEKILKGMWNETRREHNKILTKLEEIEDLDSGKVEKKDISILNSNLQEIRDAINQLNIFKSTITKKDKKEYREIGSYFQRAEGIKENIIDNFEKLNKGQKEILKEIKKGKIDPIEQIRKTRDHYWQNLKNTEYCGEMEDLYIDLQGKERRDYPDELRFDLLTKVNEFLEGDKKVLLLSGGAGAGKSMFADKLDKDMWKIYKEGKYIPVFIKLPVLKDPVNDLIPELFVKNGIARHEIANLKKKRFLFILDGYDELKEKNRKEHLYNRNGFKEWVNSKIIMTCRDEYLNDKTRALIAPKEISQGIYIASFDEKQRNEYLKKYINKKKPGWTLENYKKYIEQIQGIKELSEVPITLKMVAEELPKIIIEHEKRYKDKQVHVTRNKLYEQFMKTWFERELDKISRTGNLEGVNTEDFEDYAKKLAEEMYKDDKAEFSYFKKHRRREGVSYWDKVFGNNEMYPEDEKVKCFHALPLRKVGEKTYAFWHLTFRDYFANKGCEDLVVINDERVLDKLNEKERKILKKVFKKELVNKEEEEVKKKIINKVIDEDTKGLGKFIERINKNLADQSMIKFMVDSIEETPGYKEILFKIIEKSKKDKSVSKAAANAITALNTARVSFSGMNFEGISIPGADLTGAVMDSTNLKGSDLSNVILRASWLKNADLRNCNMQGVKFGERAYIDVGSSVESVSYSPDGRRLATGGWSYHTVRIWDAATGKHITTLKGHTNEVKSVSYSPDGRRIAAGSGDYRSGEVRIWDAVTGKHITTTLKGHTNLVTSVAYSPDGRRIATGSGDRTVRIWDAATGKHITTLKGHTGVVRSVSYSPDGRRLTTGSGDVFGMNGEVRIWDAATGKELRTLKGYTKSVLSVSYSPDGRRLATGGGNNTVRIWDARTGKHIRTLQGHTDWVLSVSYSPDGRRIVAGGRDNTVRIWDAATGKHITTLKGHTGVVRSVSYSPDGSSLATGSLDKTVRIWDAATGKHITTLKGHTSTVHSVSYSPDGRRMATGSWDRTVRIWDARTGKHITTLKGHTDAVRSVSYSPDGRRIATGSGDETVRIWDAATGKHITTLRGNTSSVWSVSYSPDGRRIATGSEDGTVRIWDARTGKHIRTLKGHTNTVKSVSYSPDGRRIATGSWGHHPVRIWDAATGKHITTLKGHTSFVWSVSYSPDGRRIATGSEDNTVRIWDAATGKHISTLKGHTSFVYSVSYSPDGRRMATGSRDNTVRIWDAVTGKHITTLKGHTSFVWSVSYSPDGRRLTTGSRDNSVKVWDIRPLKEGKEPVLLWNGTRTTALFLEGVRIEGVKGLSENNRRLMVQRGGRGEKIPI